VCIPPKEYYFGLKTFDQQEIGKDQTIFSLKKFVKLARDCNPNIIEMLYTDNQYILFLNKYGQILRDNRELFLSRKAKFTFAGYAFAQLKRIKGHRKWITFKEKEPVEEDFWVTKYRPQKNGTTKSYEKFLEQEYKNAQKKWSQYLSWKKERNPARAELEEKYGYDCKHAMHLIRLLRMGIEILETGKVVVLRPDRNELLDIRNGKWDYDKLVSYAEGLEKKLDVLYETSILRHSPDDKKIDKLLQKITEDFLNG
jgi:predicted nucleotidyltransferase